MLCLDRRSVSGKIGELTPLCVLREIAQCHSIDYPTHLETKSNFRYKLFCNIEFVVPPSIPSNPSEWTSKDLAKIAKFVNPDTSISWTRKDITTAFAWLCKYFTDNVLPSNIVLGQQKPGSLESINCCVLYRVLTHNKIEVKYDVTIDEMYQLYLDTSLPEMYLKNKAKMTINNLSNNQIVTFLDKHRVDYRPKIDSSLDFSALSAKINLEEAQTSNSAAVAYAARFGLNLSKSKYPTLEIHGIINNNNYVPQYTDCIEMMKVDPFCLQIVHNFDPNIPSKYYTIQLLTQCLKANGLSCLTNNHEDIYQVLVNNSRLPNFYHGKHSTITNSSTITGETVDELDYNDVLCYGVKTEKLEAMTYDEILLYMKSSGMPLNPCSRTPTQLLDKERSKLLQLATIYKKTDLKIYLENYAKSDVQDQLVARISALRKSEHKNKVDSVLSELRNMAMFARGWDGKGPYPVTGNGPHTHVAETNTMNSMLNVYTLDQSLKNATDLSILDFPLFKFDEKGYSKFTNQEKGRTIGERMLIMKYSNVQIPVEGYEIYCNNINGCIRTSSNYILATIYYIGLNTGFDPKYDITEVQWLG